MNTNEYILKLLQNSSVLEKPLNRHKNYLIQTEIEIDDVATPDNKDGTKDVVYKARCKGLIAIKKEKDKVVIAVNKKNFTPAQLTRFSLEAYHDKHYGEPMYEFIHHDSQEFYQQFYSKLRGNLDNVIRLLFTKP